MSDQKTKTDAKEPSEMDALRADNEDLKKQLGAAPPERSP